MAGAKTIWRHSTMTALATVLSAGLAQAATAQDGAPMHAVPDADVSLFNAENADRASAALSDLRAATASCDTGAVNAAISDIDALRVDAAQASAPLTAEDAADFDALVRLFAGEPAKARAALLKCRQPNGDDVMVSTAAAPESASDNGLWFGPVSAAPAPAAPRVETSSVETSRVDTPTVINAPTPTPIVRPVPRPVDDTVAMSRIVSGPGVPAGGVVTQVPANAPTPSIFAAPNPDAAAPSRIISAPPPLEDLAAANAAPRLEQDPDALTSAGPRPTPTPVVAPRAAAALSNSRNPLVTEAARRAAEAYGLDTPLEAYVIPQEQPRTRAEHRAASPAFGLYSARGEASIATRNAPLEPDPRPADAPITSDPKELAKEAPAYLIPTPVESQTQRDRTPLGVTVALGVGQQRSGRPAVTRLTAVNSDGEGPVVRPSSAVEGTRFDAEVSKPLGASGIVGRLSYTRFDGDDQDSQSDITVTGSSLRLDGVSDGQDETLGLLVGGDPDVVIDSFSQDADVETESIAASIEWPVLGTAERGVKVRLGLGYRREERSETTQVVVGGASPSATYVADLDADGMFALVGVGGETPVAQNRFGAWSVFADVEAQLARMDADAVDEVTTVAPGGAESTDAVAVNTTDDGFLFSVRAGARLRLTERFAIEAEAYAERDDMALALQRPGGAGDVTQVLIEEADTVGVAVRGRVSF